MEINDALLALRGAGITAVAEDARTLRTSTGERIRVSRRPVPSSVDMEGVLATGERVLVQVKRLTPALRQKALQDHRIILAIGDKLVIDGELVSAEEQTDDRKRRRGRKPYGEFAVARALLSTSPPRPLVQEEIAERAGIRQPAVSEALRRLGPFVARSRVGWQAAHRKDLFDYAATEYPGAGGITTYWWHADDIHTQAAVIAKHTEGALLGGDLAASNIAGWRQPEHALVYLHTGLDPALHGFVAATHDDHTLELVVPADTTLWASAQAFHTAECTDPVTTYFDVRRTGFTGDQDEAADHLRDVFLKGAES